MLPTVHNLLYVDTFIRLQQYFRLEQRWRIFADLDFKSAKKIVTNPGNIDICMATQGKFIQTFGISAAVLKGIVGSGT